MTSLIRLRYLLNERRSTNVLLLILIFLCCCLLIGRDGPELPSLGVGRLQGFVGRALGPLKCPPTFGKVAVFFVYTDYANYRHASNTLRCYAHSRGYPVLYVQPYEDQRVQKVCGHLRDIFFIKHCAASVYLADYEWLLVTDADTAVMNADRCIEEFLEKKADVIMYERFFTAELMSGNYLVQNTPNAHLFLRAWAEMESERPPAPIFCSADNGLLHVQMLRTLYPDKPKISEGCWKVLNTSIWPDYEPGFGAFLRCARKPLLHVPASENARARILVHQRAQSFCRDPVFTDFDLWAGDFLGHGIKHSEPFEEAGLQRLVTFANDTVPDECYDPDWRPKRAKGRMLSENEMRLQLRDSANGLEGGKLRPLFFDMHWERCWPNCTAGLRNF